jgi:hypothetical protein
MVMRYSWNFRDRVYIAGRVTGLEYDDYYFEFYCAEKQLEFKGYEVVNPVRFCKVHWGWKRCMTVCLFHLIFRCNKVYMLAGWEQSRGARIEYKIARMLRYKRIER